jgi:hypothetical protein
MRDKEEKEKRTNKRKKIRKIATNRKREPLWSTRLQFVHNIRDRDPISDRFSSWAFVKVQKKISFSGVITLRQVYLKSWPFSIGCEGSLRVELVGVGQNSCLKIQRSGFDPRLYQIFREVVGLERGPLSLVSTSDELLERKK